MNDKDNSMFSNVEVTHQEDTIQTGRFSSIQRTEDEVKDFIDSVFTTQLRDQSISMARNSSQMSNGSRLSKQVSQLKTKKISTLKSMVSAITN